MKLVRRWLVRLVALTVAWAGFVPAWAADDGDWQLWAEQSVQGKLTDTWTVTVKQEQKWDDEGFLEFLVDFGLKYQADPRLELGLIYRQQYEKKADDWLEENRPIAYGTFKWNRKGFALADRNRFELRFRDGRDTILRYRNKLSATGPWAFSSWSAKPYVADEIFIDSDQGELNRNRLYLGLKAKPATHLKSELYGLWQTSDNGTHWIDVYVVGLKVGFAF